jgi:hypothetical protein
MCVAKTRFGSSSEAIAVYRGLYLMKLIPVTAVEDRAGFRQAGIGRTFEETSGSETPYSAAGK